MNIKENNWKIWLIRSSFSGTTPKNVCEFVKLFTLALIMSPFTWMAHVINYFRNDFEFPYKWGFGFLFIGMFISAICCAPGNNGNSVFYEFTHNFSINEKMLFVYFTAPISMIALICVLILVMLVGLVVSWPIDWFQAKRKAYKWERQSEKNEPSTASWFVMWIRGIKEKYCVQINYIK